MEKAGLIRSIELLQEEDISIGTLVTDRHRSIAKWIRESLPETRHCYDVWHVAKGLKKKLQALAKLKDCSIVAEWIRSIINHLYWCASSTPDGNRDVVGAKWLSVVNHVKNVHRHANSLFPKCTHPRKYKKRGDVVHWLTPGTCTYVYLFLSKCLKVYIYTL